MLEEQKEAQEELRDLNRELEKTESQEDDQAKEELTWEQKKQDA